MTEAQIIEYMKKTVPSGVLGLENIDFADAYGQLVLEYGDGPMDDVKKIKALARVQAWLKVIAEVTLDYDFKDDRASYNRSQMHKMALESLALAERYAMPYMASYKVTIKRIPYKDDPYRNDS